MMQADTPMPGEDPGALIEDEDRLDEIEPGPKNEGGDPAAPAKDETPGADDVERDIVAVRKAEKRDASARRRKARPNPPSGRDAAGDPASASGCGRP